MPRRLGQHFLNQRSYLQKIAAAVCPEPAGLVIEIGAGKGALTRHLLARASSVVAIELDAGLAAGLRKAFADQARLAVVEADILQTDLTQWGPAVVAGNLPYYITSPVIERTLAMGDLLRRAVFLVQKEVARRLVARPGGRDYGFLSVSTQLFTTPRVLFGVPAGAFTPPPKVDSAAVLLEPALHPRPRDAASLLAFVGLCFRKKRKTLRNNLALVFGAEAVDRLPEASLRGEQLSLEQFQDLYARLTAGSPRGAAAALQPPSLQ